MLERVQQPKDAHIMKTSDKDTTTWLAAQSFEVFGVQCRVVHTRTPLTGKDNSWRGQRILEQRKIEVKDDMDDNYGNDDNDDVGKGCQDGSGQPTPGEVSLRESDLKQLSVQQNPSNENPDG